MTDTARQELASHNWPGNIRELSNVLERCLLMCTQDLIDARLVNETIGGEALEPFIKNNEKSTSTIETLDKVEERMITKALFKMGGNQSETAKLLGISRHALSRRLDKFGIDFESK